MKEIKFAYRYKPTNQWVYLTTILEKESFLDEFISDILYSAKNIIMEDLYYLTKYNNAYNINDFELVEIEIKYKLPK